MGFLWIGVDLFYVLSGFFIGSAVLRPQEWQPVAFIKNRLTRILPAYYVSMFVVLLLLERSMLDNAQGWINIAMQVLMLHNLQEWSLGILQGWQCLANSSIHHHLIRLSPSHHLKNSTLMMYRLQGWPLSIKKTYYPSRP